MNTIKEKLKENRPNLSKGSLNTYNSILNNVFMNVSKSNEKISPEWFIKNQNRIIDFLKDMSPTTRKLKLSALLVLCQEDKECAEKYKNLMLVDIKTTNDEDKKQEKSEKQKDAWISQKEVQRIHDDMRDAVSYILKKPIDKVNPREKNALQDYILLSLYVYNPPRRSQDYTNMVLRDHTEGEDNYIKGRKFIFNTYKTAKTYGQQQVDIDPKLFSLITRWRKMYPNQKYLLENQQGEQLKNTDITRILNKIFGKKISVNMLRHIYISDEILENMPKLTELEKKAEDMGHSVSQQILYKKV